MIEHEMAHGMLYNSGFNKNYSNPIDPTAVVKHTRVAEVEEGIAYTMALVAKNYRNHDVNPLAPISWTLNTEMALPSGNTIDVANLKGSGWPNTYGALISAANYTLYGEAAYDNDNGYEKNAGVILNWLRLVTLGGDGHIDDDDAAPAFHIEPIDPDPLTAMETASSFLFGPASDLNTGNYIYDIPSLALTILDKVAAKTSGYEEGTPKYIAMYDAWYAVGVMEKRYSGTIKNEKPVIAYAHSLYNSVVPIDVTEGDVIIDKSAINKPNKPGPNKIRILESQTGLQTTIKTLIQHSDGNAEIAYDGDEDGNNDAYNNKKRAEVVTAVHFASEKAVKYMDSVYAYHSIDIKSFVGKGVKNPGFNTVDKNFYYSYLGPIDLHPAVSMDLVASEIGYSAAILNTTWSSGVEIDAICRGLGDVLGLQVKNDELTAHGDPTLWTMGEKLYGGVDYLRSFSDPKSRNQPTYYKGINYDQSGTADAAKTNSSLINYLLYILANGKNGNLDDDPAKPTYSVPAIGVAAAENIVWNAVMNSQTVDVQSFADLAKAAEASALTTAELDAVKAACYAIGLAPTPLPELASTPVNEAVDINPWPVKISKEILYAGAYVGLPDGQSLEKKWVVEISKNKDFKGGKTFTFPSKELLLGTDTKLVGGKLYVETTMNLRPNTTYYWKVRTTEFDVANCHMSSTACVDIQKQLAEGSDDIRSFTTDSRAVTALPSEEDPYPWGGTEFKCNRLDAEDPAIPIKNYHVKIYKHDYSNNNYLSKIADEFINSDPAKLIQSHTDGKLMLNADDYYLWEVCATGQPDVFSDPNDPNYKENEGEYTKQMSFHTQTPFTSSLMQADIHPFNPHALVIPWEETDSKNAAGYEIRIYRDNAKQKLVHPESVPLGVPGIPGQEIDMLAFNNEPKKDISNYYYEVIPVSPPLTGGIPATRNNGKMSSLYPFGVNPLNLQWSETRAVPISPDLNTVLSPEGDPTTFTFKSVTYATEYVLEVASPNFINPTYSPPPVHVPAANSLIMSANMQVAPTGSGFQWRVTAMKGSLKGLTSEPMSAMFAPGKIKLQYPLDGQKGITLENPAPYIYFTSAYGIPDGAYLIFIREQSNNSLVDSYTEKILDPGPQSLEYIVTTPLQEGHTYILDIMPVDKNGGDISILESISTFTMTKAPPPPPPPSAKHKIIITWNCGCGNPKDNQVGQYILDDQIMSVSTGDPIVFDSYVTGTDENGTPFQTHLEYADLWDPNQIFDLTSWVVNADIPSGDYKITMVTKNMSAFPNTVYFNIEVDGKVLAIQPHPNPNYMDSVTFTITIP